MVVYRCSVRRVMVTRQGSCSSNIGSGTSDCSEAVCPVCSKSFDSKNAMYGHLRCHPERGWRGTRPPPPSAETGSCSTVSQKVDGPSPSTMEPVGVSGPALAMIPSSSTSVSSSTDVSSCNGNEVKEHNQGREEPGRTYKCSSCGMVFQTFQALGGHRSGHSYRKNIEAMDSGEDQSNGAAKRFFKCDVCSKTFPSGQALGGHKRAHFGDSAKPCRSFDLNKPPPL